MHYTALSNLAASHFPIAWEIPSLCFDNYLNPDLLSMFWSWAEWIIKMLSDASLLIHYSFWNAGLTEESLALLAGSLDACKCLNYLSVEANIPTLANFYLLTDSDSSVKYLYLRYNKIDSHTLLRVVQVILILINRCNSKENNSLRKANLLVQFVFDFF